MCECVCVYDSYNTWLWFSVFRIHLYEWWEPNQPNAVEKRLANWKQGYEWKKVRNDFNANVSDSFDRVDFLFDNLKRCSVHKSAWDTNTTNKCNGSSNNNNCRQKERQQLKYIHSVRTSNRNVQITTLTETTELGLILLCIASPMILETSDHIVRIQFMHIEFHLHSRSNFGREKKKPNVQQQQLFFFSASSSFFVCLFACVYAVAAAIVKCVV